MATVTFYQKFKKCSVKEILALEMMFMILQGSQHGSADFVDQVVPYCLSACHFTAASGGGLKFIFVTNEGHWTHLYIQRRV